MAEDSPHDSKRTDDKRLQDDAKTFDDPAHKLRELYKEVDEYERSLTAAILAVAEESGVDVRQMCQGTEGYQRIFWLVVGIQWERRLR